MDFSFGPMMISEEKKGPELILKQSFPLRAGRFFEIRTRDFEFCFNLNGEIKSIRGLRPDWPHPAEQLKRTIGNDWVYYTVGDKSGDDGVVSWMGEYYLPCLPYPSNPVWEIDYRTNPLVMEAFGQWSQLYANLYMANSKGLYARSKELIEKILANDDNTLFARANHLNEIIGGRVSVLPPDTRHVDYEVIPLTIADGCLYKCKFCCVKSDQTFKNHSREEIQGQIKGLINWFGKDIVNYHALFLGAHDAFAAGSELICCAASEAYSQFGFRQRMGQDPYLYMFASVGSFLKADQALFDQLNDLPFFTYINIGFESADQDTLKMIGKPITSEQVEKAFDKMVQVNSEFDRLAVTGNFVASEVLPEAHVSSLARLLEYGAADKRKKGIIYLSPLQDSPKKRELLPMFYKIKEESPLPVLTYLIQRL